MSVDAATVKKTARLARIAIDEGEIDSMTEKLSAILDWVEQLQEVDVEGVPPMTSVSPMALKLRADAVTAGDDADRILASAPSQAEGFFVVPKVVE